MNITEFEQTMEIKKEFAEVNIKTENLTTYYDKPIPMEFVSTHSIHTEIEIKQEPSDKLVNSKLNQQINRRTEPQEQKKESNKRKDGSKLERVNCNLCDATFKNNYNLKIHTKIKHIAEKPLKCDLCEYRCLLPSSLRVHQRVHTGDTPYKCKDCHESFKYLTAFKTHILKIHTGERPHKCTECGQLFYHARSLRTHAKRHLAANHRIFRKVSVKDPIKCEYCDKMFTKIAHFKEHIRKHTGEKPYKCNECEASFAFGTSLKLHIRRQHTGEKPYECPTCHKGFYMNGDLSHHIKRSKCSKS